VKRLTAVCDELHAFEGQMVHAADQQLTYLRTLYKVSKQNTKDTVDLATVLSDSIRNFSLQLGRNEADLLDTQAAIEKQARYNAEIRDAEVAILNMKFCLTQL
jgi:type II secretory pathway component PulM